MTQTIFIGEVMLCELSRRKCAANSLQAFAEHFRSAADSGLWLIEDYLRSGILALRVAMRPLIQLARAIVLR